MLNKQDAHVIAYYVNQWSTRYPMKWVRRPQDTGSKVVWIKRRKS